MIRARRGVRHAGRRLEPPLRRRRPALPRRARRSSWRVTSPVVGVAGRGGRGATSSACTWRSRRRRGASSTRASSTRLQPGRFLINTSRGEVVDQAALGRGGRGEAGSAPASTSSPASRPAATGAFDDPLVALPGVYGTHHIGASTDQAQEAIAAETVRIVRTYKETGRVPERREPARKTPATHMLVVRHRDAPASSRTSSTHLRAADINVQETENIVFDGRRSRRRADQPRSGAVARLALRRRSHRATAIARRPRPANSSHV